jgi:hypothetical protein
MGWSIEEYLEAPMEVIYSADTLRRFEADEAKRASK